MFGHNDGPPPPPGADTPHGPVPQVPPLRTYLVRRKFPLVRPLTNELGTETTSALVLVDEVIEEICISAHEVEFNQSGNILRFREFYIDAVEGPTNRVVICFNGWLDYKDVTPKRERSLLLSGESIH